MNLLNVGIQAEQRLNERPFTEARSAMAANVAREQNALETDLRS